MGRMTGRCRGKLGEIQYTTKNTKANLLWGEGAALLDNDLAVVDEDLHRFQQFLCGVRPTAVRNPHGGCELAPHKNSMGPLKTQPPPPLSLSTSPECVSGTLVFA